MANHHDICIKPEISDLKLQNIIILKDSFGYSSQQAHNLAILDNNLFYSSGLILNILNLNDYTLKIKYCSRNAIGIGHITTNVKYKHVAVGETGENPNVFIYEWPNFNIIAKLNNAAKKTFVCLNYSSNGDVICCQAGQPDYSLSLWEWKNENLLIKFQPSDQAIYRALFSPVHQETIITCGVGHIGFWRTVKTFTGMKITGENGKFGATEATDVPNVECLPNGKVASGCSWGNILIWSNEQVEYEIAPKRGKKKCHRKIAAVFHSVDNRLVSIGSDGWVRLWDLQDNHPTEKGGKIVSLQESILYFNIAKNANILSKVLVSNKYGIENWILQDGNGAIWQANAEEALRGKSCHANVKKIIRTHMDGVVAISSSPYDTKYASVSISGRLIIRDYAKPLTNNIICEKEIHLPASRLLWLPVEVDSCGNKILVGFENGVIAVYYIRCNKLKELQAVRPHKMRVCLLSSYTHKNGNSFIVTVGEDGLLCLFDIQKYPCFYMKLRGILKNDEVVKSIDLKSIDNDNMNILIFSNNAKIMEYELTVLPTKHENNSLVLPLKLKQEISLREALNIKDISSIIRGLYGDENSIITIITIKIDTFIFYINSHNEREKLLTPDNSIATCSLIINKNIIIIGYNTGIIQINYKKANKCWEYWRCRMHSSEVSSTVSDLCLNYTNNYLFSSGLDGNEFLYALSQEFVETRDNFAVPTTFNIYEKQSGRPARNLSLTLEEINDLKINRKNKRNIKNKKFNIMKKLEKLSSEYEEFMSRDDIPNEIKPKSSEDLNLRLKHNLENEIQDLRSSFLGEIELKKIKSNERWESIENYFLSSMECDSLRVYTIRDDTIFIESYRLHRLNQETIEEYKKIKHYGDKSFTADCKTKTEIIKPVNISEDCSSSDSIQIQSSVKQDDEDIVTDSLILERIKKYRDQRKKRIKQIDELNNMKPGEVAILCEEDLAKIYEAELTIGDYRLKCDSQYPSPPDINVSPLRTKYQILNTQLKIHNLKREFNYKILQLKERKNKLISVCNEKLSENGNLDLFNNTLKLHEKETADNDMLQLCGRTGLHCNISVEECNYDSLKTVQDFEEEISKFDESSRRVYIERAETDTQITVLKLKLLSLTREQIILDEMAPEEDAIKKELENAKKEKHKLETKLSEFREEIKIYKKQVNELRKEEKSIETRLLNHVEGEQNNYYKTLLAILKSKTLSTKGSTSIDSSIESDNDSEILINYRNRPSVACDPKILLFTHALRSERNTIVEQYIEKRNYLTKLRKEEEILIKKINLIISSIQFFNEEFKQFQTKRQEKFNKIEEVVALKLHQLPADVKFSECVLLSENELRRLQGRAQELRNDTIRLEQLYMTDKKHLQSLIKKTEKTNNTINELKIAIDETMRKRFGKVINLDDLEITVLTGNYDSTRNDALKKEHLTELSHLKKRVNNLRKKENILVEEKAEKMKYLARLMKNKNDMSVVNSPEHVNCRHSTIPEKHHRLLKQREILKSIEEQVEAAKHEIALLRCKMTSSRDLFPYVSNQTNAGSTEDTTDEHTTRVSSSATSIIAPEIYIQHCPDPEEDEDYDDEEQ